MKTPFHPIFNSKIGVYRGFHFSLIFALKHIVGTRQNRLNKAVLTCTHNQCFEQKYEKHHNFSSENYCFYSREKLQYITWACFRNEYLKFQASS